MCMNSIALQIKTKTSENAPPYPCCHPIIKFDPRFIIMDRGTAGINLLQIITNRMQINNTYTQVGLYLYTGANIPGEYNPFPSEKVTCGLLIWPEAEAVLEAISVQFFSFISPIELAAALQMAPRSARTEGHRRRWLQCRPVTRSLPPEHLLMRILIPGNLWNYCSNQTRCIM